MDDFIERKLDLNELLIRHEAATYFIRVQGDSMTGAGIHDGDILIVDRAEEPRDGRIVIAVLNGELTVKRIRRRGDRLVLQAENDHYPEIEVTPETSFEIWGVVRHVIHSLT
jgi:DNA polymerase V